MLRNERAKLRFWRRVCQVVFVGQAGAGGYLIWLTFNLSAFWAATLPIPCFMCWAMCWALIVVRHQEGRLDGLGMGDRRR